MKGFVYLIEIAVAAIIMTVALSVFFSIRVKQDWQRGDIVSVGNNILDSISNSNSIFRILEENFTDIDSNKPQNVKYGLKILGSPRSNIIIGCVLYCDYLQKLLNPLGEYDYGSVYVNGRWINFTLNPFDINSSIPEYDAIILVNYTGYSDSLIRSRLVNYTKKGGVVIGINATTTNSNLDFNRIFNLSAGSGSSSTLNFTSYNPSDDETEKYFLGIGLEADTDWYIWEQQFRVDYWGSNRFDITNVQTPSINVTNLAVGSVFNLTGPDSNLYYFKIKNMWYPDRVDFQVLNKTFVFKEFSERNVKGKNIVGSAGYAAMTTNNSVVWMSNFPESSEYASLLKAAILSKVDIWTAKEIRTSGERTALSSFITLCCDMPETAELYLTLWYQV